MKPNPRRFDIDVYPNRFDIATRFSDVDSQSHLNNVRLMEYYQEGRVHFHHALPEEFNFEQEAGSRILVAHQSVDYLQEVRYPGVITLGVGLLRIGNSSYTMGAGLFQDGRCAGLAMTVIVYGSKAATPAALPAAVVAVLRKKLLPDDAL